jgi:hypothetical protein
MFSIIYLRNKLKHEWRHSSFFNRYTITSVDLSNYFENAEMYQKMLHISNRTLKAFLEEIIHMVQVFSV